ncbi:MAG: hypothetical protein KGL67_02835 [Patescibacteria group bacterium]|nr:hypothetical protein [Patescibacteria group bacterium]
MNLSNLFSTAQNILNSIIPILVSLGLVFFIWGVVQYVIAGGEEAKKRGRDRIIYGIIGLAVITSLWGLVNLVVNTFHLAGTAPTYPTTTAGCNTAGGVGTTFRNLVGYIDCTIKDSIIPFIFAVALAAFVWGVVKFFIINADEEAKRSQGKQFMVWGLIAMTVMLCVWGLVAILGSTFNIDIRSEVPPQTAQ